MSGTTGGTDRTGNARIKVKVMAVLPDRAGTAHLVMVGADSRKQPDRFHRLLGGHLEFGESTRAGVEREVAEETGSRLLDPRLLGVLESRFVHEGEPGHEIVFVYTGRLADPDVVPAAGGTLQDNDEPMPVAWRPVVDDDVELPLYPDGVGALVRSALLHPPGTMGS